MNTQPDIDVIRRDAEVGVAGAQYNLGVWYLNEPAGRDPEQAKQWFTKAAEQAFPPAQSALGYLFLQARGVDYDANAAANWFSKAADTGFDEAQYRLGEMHGAGIGVDQDSERSYSLLTKAAEQGHPQALTQRAYCLGHGVGCDTDHLEATRVYAAAAQAGDPRAQCVIASRYETGFMLQQDDAQAAAWYGKAAANRYTAAELALQRLGKENASAPTEILPSNTGNSPLACRVETLSDRPRVFQLKNFMDAEECFHLMAFSRPFLRPSKVLQRGTGQLVETEGRRSGSMRFANPLRDIVIWNLEQRLAQYSKLPAENGEPLTVLHYAPGDEYRPHHDFFDPSVPGREVALRNGGQRVATLMTYLNDVDKGGETEFLETGLRIPPTQGTGILFFNVLPDGAIDPMSRHAGTPVLAGEKWLATRWIRESAFDPRRT